MNQMSIISSTINADISGMGSFLGIGQAVAKGNFEAALLGASVEPLETLAKQANNIIAPFAPVLAEKASELKTNLATELEDLSDLPLGQNIMQFFMQNREEESEVMTQLKVILGDEAGVDAFKRIINLLEKGSLSVYKDMDDLKQEDFADLSKSLLERLDLAIKQITAILNKDAGQGISAEEMLSQFSSNFNLDAGISLNNEKYKAEEFNREAVLSLLGDMLKSGLITSQEFEQIAQNSEGNDFIIPLLNELKCETQKLLSALESKSETLNLTEKVSKENEEDILAFFKNIMKESGLKAVDIESVKADDKDFAKNLDIEIPETKSLEVEEKDEAEIKIPKTENFEAKNPEAKSAEIRSSEAIGSEMKSEEIKNTETMKAETIEAKKTETISAEAKIFETKLPETKIPETKSFETKSAETKNAEIKSSEAVGSEMKHAEAKEVEAKRTEIRNPETKNFEAKNPEMKNVEAKIPEIKIAEIKNTEAKMPEARSFETKNFEMKSIETSGTEIKSSEMKVQKAEPEVRAVWEGGDLKIETINPKTGEKLQSIPMSSTHRMQERINEFEVVRQVVAQARFITTPTGEQKMTMQLRPEHLGQVDLRITLNHGEMQIHARVESAPAQAALENHIGLLREGLEKQGITLDRLEVSVEQREHKDTYFAHEREEHRNGKNGKHKRGKASHLAVSIAKDESSDTGRRLGYNTMEYLA